MADPTNEGPQRKLRAPKGVEDMMKEIDGAVNGDGPTTSSNPEYSRKRVMGSEQEYGIWIKESGNGGWGFKRSGFLENGGLLLEDCGHPEYASPEASNPLDAVLFDKAGELIVSRLVKANDPKLFKHNRDSRGNSFASHESYSLARTNFQSLVDATLPFFATRIIFAGSGFINDEGKYELSQKAGVTRYDVCEGTDGKKAIFNTRDEPLADPEKYMRLHVVSGDANMSEPALFLKFGTTGLVADLFEDKKLRLFKLENAVDTFHRISRDTNFERKYNVGGNGEMSAIEIQRFYQEAAESAYRGRDDVTDDILNRWKFVLDNLEEDPMVLDRWLDWTIKKGLIDSYRQKTGKSLGDAAVRNIDLQYHDVDRSGGLFYKLQDSGMVDRLVSDSQIEYATQNPPQDTRARVRGVIVAQEGLQEKKVGWDFIQYRSKDRKMLQKCEECPIKDCAQYEHRVEQVKLKDPLNNYEEVEVNSG
jgi:proteasome accessory factor A